MNIFECTIKMKEERRGHYLQLADSTEDQQLKRIALLLADANSELIRQVREIEKSGEAASSSADELSESVCMFTSRFDARHPDVALSSDSDAYRHVVAEIEDAIAFYDQLGAKAETERMKTVYGKLADVERSHLTTVENIYAFVEDPRTFLEWGEFGNIKPL
jgi:rubrerythrin